MKSIKEKAKEYDRVVERISPNQSIVDMSGRKLFEAGANYALDAIEEFMTTMNFGDNSAEKFYKLDLMADIHKFIEQLKSNQ